MSIAVMLSAALLFSAPAHATTLVDDPAHAAAAASRHHPPYPRWREYCTGDYTDPDSATCHYTLKPTITTVRRYIQWRESTRPWPPRGARKGTNTQTDRGGRAK